MTNTRTADHPIDPQFVARWSPRAFGTDAITEGDLLTILEAGRWAPSSYNAQPWRFAYALRDDPAWAGMLDLLTPSNLSWAKHAAALVFIASKRTFRPPGADSDVASYTHSLDAGAAWAFISLQAHILGWSVHGMAGVDYPRAARELGLSEDFRLEMGLAIGRRGDPSGLAPHYQAMETPNSRKPLAETAAHGRFPAT